MLIIHRKDESGLLLDGDSSSAVALQKRVDLGVIPLELELLAEFLSDGGFDCLKNVLKHTKVGRVVLVVVAALEDTSTDKACVPPVKVLENALVKCTSRRVHKVHLHLR